MAAKFERRAAAASCFLLSLALTFASLAGQGEARGGKGGGRLGSVPVCWSSDEHGGHVADASQSHDLPASGRGAVVFVGVGGRVCRVGAICSFDMLVRRPARWAPGTPHRKRELMATLRGPALALAAAEEMAPMDGSRFRFSFRVWDAGPYMVSVSCSCSSLMWRLGPWTPMGLQAMGFWELNVTSWHNQAEEGNLSAGGLLEPGASRLKGDDPLPCESSSVQGRWLLVEDEYRWVQYPCARTVPLGDWIPELNRAGIREINFIGDSHNRQIAHHLYYLVSGKRLDPLEPKWIPKRRLTINHKSGASLVLSINFIKGIYDSNDEFQCSMIFRDSPKAQWANISRTADVYMLDAGAWTGMFCKESEMAFVAHFARFLEWATFSLRSRAKESLPLLLYRTVPPQVQPSGCNDMTNVYVNFANSMAKEVAASQGFLTFDAHEVEGPRYVDHCGEMHFSCDDKDGRVIGEVGVGDAIAFVHFLLRYYKGEAHK